MFVSVSRGNIFHCAGVNLEEMHQEKCATARTRTLPFRRELGGSDDARGDKA
jgi:hypothetical protein